VEVATGVVHLQRLVAVDDCGIVLDPMIVEGQLHGSLMQGLGQALLEEIRYDDSAQPLTSTLIDYLIPSASMRFPLIADRLFSPAPSNPLGVKGTGEAGCIGAPAAVLNAVYDALAPWNPINLNLPLTPYKVWTVIHGTRE
jgi:carbon-monoxide dehydrogenase large subunit